MPYKKSYKKRPGYKACGKMVYGDAKKALAIAKSVKSMINVEYNIRDTVLTSLSSPVVGTIEQLTNMGQGDSNILRDGNQVKYTHIQLKYFFTINASATETCCRIILVHDKQTNGAIYLTSALLANVSAFDNVNSPFNENFRRRFKILYDRVHDLSIDGNAIGRGQKFLKINLPVRYNGTGSTITALTESSLSLVHLSTEATNTPTFHAFVRLLFVDN